VTKRGKEKNGKKTVWTVLAVLSVLILVVCGVSIARQVLQIQQQRQLDSEMSQIARPSQDPDATPAPTATPDPAQTQEAVPSETVAPVAQEIDFDALHEENEEIIAWITLDGTVIDYPLLCRPEDDAYYHTHNVKGQEAVAGSIYIQGSYNSTDFSDFHTVVYGHNMRDGSMFAGLHKFEDKDFFDQHDTVVLYTPTQRLTYTIFAAYARDDAHLMRKFDYSTEQGRQAFLDDIFTHSGNFRDVELTNDSQILTLSTCIGSAADQRYVVQAVLTEAAPVANA
jgi:sortase B